MSVPLNKTLVMSGINDLSEKVSKDGVPFLRNVTRGKNIPEERLKEVGEHYYGFGGRSPINEQNLALLAVGGWLWWREAAKSLDQPNRPLPSPT